MRPRSKSVSTFAVLLFVGGSLTHTATSEASGVRNPGAVAVFSGAPTGSGCWLYSTGAVSCQGDPATGIRGTGSAEEQPTAPVVGILDATQVSVRGDYACALLTSGQVKCWGRQAGVGSNGQPTAVVLEPREIAGLTNVVDIAVSSRGACAVSPSDGVVCWGSAVKDTFSGTSSGGFLDQLPHAPDLALVRNTLGAARISLQPDSLSGCMISTMAVASCWGYAPSIDTSGPGCEIVGGFTFCDQAVALPVLPRVQDVQLGRDFGCALGIDTFVYCWGRNSNDRFGSNLVEAGTEQVPVGLRAGRASGVRAEVDFWCYLSTQAGTLSCRDRADVTHEKRLYGDGLLVDDAGGCARVGYISAFQCALGESFVFGYPLTADPVNIDCQSGLDAVHCTWTGTPAESTTRVRLLAADGSLLSEQGATNSWSKTALSPATAYRVVLAISRSDGSSSVFSTWVFTAGTKAQHVKVLKADGTPASGGSVSWRMQDGSAWSSKSYGLNANGEITFPAAPSGLANITIGRVDAGDLQVSGPLRDVILGQSVTIIRLPVFPRHKFRAKVVLPNGKPVSGAVVRLLGFDLHQDETVRDFMLSAVRTDNTIKSDADGLVTFAGIPQGTADRPTFEATYDDGVITQKQTTAATDAPVTAVPMRFMPWVEPTGGTYTAAKGQRLVISLRALQQVSSSGSTAPVAGVTVSATAPKGTCGSQLSGTTNKQGVAAIALCATATGYVQLRARGATTAGKVFIKVTKTAPTAPAAMSCLSSSAGAINCAWKSPAFDGGATPQKAEIQLRGPDGKTRIVLVALKTRKWNIANLKNAARYSVSIREMNRYGWGPVSSVQVAVA